MSRYQIGIGNEFPVDEDLPGPEHRHGGCGSWSRSGAARWGGSPWAGPGGERFVGRFGLAPGPLVLRAIFLLSLGVVAVTHAVAVVLILGAFLLLRHSPLAHEARARWHHGRPARWQRRMDDGAFV